MVSGVVDVRAVDLLRVERNSDGLRSGRCHSDGRNRSHQLTSEGGFEPRESSDGQYVYFVTDRARLQPGPGDQARTNPDPGVARRPWCYSGINPGAWESHRRSGIVFVIGPRAVRTETQPDTDVLAVYDVDAHQRAAARRACVSRGSLGSPPIPHCVARWAMGARQPTSIGWERDIFVVDEFR